MKQLVIDGNEYGFDISEMKAWFNDEGVEFSVDTSGWTTDQWSEVLGAQPIIRCKNCRFFEYNHVEKVDEVPLIVAHEICTAWSGGSKTSENGWCFLAEKKEADK